MEGIQSNPQDGGQEVQGTGEKPDIKRETSVKKETLNPSQKAGPDSSSNGDSSASHTPSPSPQGGNNRKELSKRLPSPINDAFIQNLAANSEMIPGLAQLVKTLKNLDLKVLCEMVIEQLISFSKTVSDKIYRFRKENPILFTLICVALCTGICAGLAVPMLSAIGFGSGGVIAGSLAAAIHSAIGNVVAGSAFAVLQSLTATGLIAAVGAGIGGLGGGILAAVIWREKIKDFFVDTMGWMWGERGIRLD